MDRLNPVDADPFRNPIDHLIPPGAVGAAIWCVVPGSPYVAIKNMPADDLAEAARVLACLDEAWSSLAKHLAEKMSIPLPVILAAVSTVLDCKSKEELGEVLDMFRCMKVISIPMDNPEAWKNAMIKAYAAAALKAMEKSAQVPGPSKSAFDAYPGGTNASGN